MAAVSKSVPFNEENLRKISSIKEALKVYQEQKVPTRRIVREYQKAYTILQGNVSINAQYFTNLSSTKQKEFLSSTFGKNTTRVKLFEKEYQLWRDKFSGRVVVPPVTKAPIEPISKEETEG